MTERISIRQDISETAVAGLSKIERHMLNTLLAGLESLDDSLHYEILIADDDPEEVGVNIYKDLNFIAEVYCAQLVSGLTGEYQVSTPQDEDGPSMLLLAEAALRITNPS